MGWVEDKYGGTGKKPRENAGLAGQDHGSSAFQADLDVEEVLWDNGDIRRLAQTKCEKWWANLTTKMERPDAFDADERRRAYIAKFMKWYNWSRDYRTEHGWLKRPPAPTTTASVRVVSARHFEDAQLYELELTDSEHLPNPIRFELVVRNNGEPAVSEQTLS
jgi:hypothetical protein